jgi:Tol biopolymer transport system component
VWETEPSAIFTTNVGGGTILRLPYGVLTTYGVVDLDYSPSGKKIAYAEGTQGGGSPIYTINAAGGGRAVAIKGFKWGAISFFYSPDGKKIAYSGWDRKRCCYIGDYEIYTISVGGGKLIQLTHNKTDDFSPSWGGSR